MAGLRVKLATCFTENDTGCWEWKYTRDRWGYGKVQLAGVYMLASKAAYLCLVGEIAEGRIVRHICDNPPCIFPGHLELGVRGAKDPAEAQRRVERYIVAVRALKRPGPPRTDAQIVDEMVARSQAFRRKRYIGSLELLREKLLANFAIGPSGCWEWTAARDRYGYGKVAYAGLYTSASRASHMCFIGPIAKGLVVRHACDNPPCINPEHLVAGTHRENMADRLSRIAQYIAAVRAAGKDLGRTNEDLLEELRTRGQSFRRR